MYVIMGRRREPQAADGVMRQVSVASKNPPPAGSAGYSGRCYIFAILSPRCLSDRILNRISSRPARPQVPRLPISLLQILALYVPIPYCSCLLSRASARPRSSPRPAHFGSSQILSRLPSSRYPIHPSRRNSSTARRLVDARHMPSVSYAPFVFRSSP